MSHKTLVGGVTYDTLGGKCLVGGVAYSIQNGRAMVDGTVFDVNFTKIPTITITGLGSTSGSCYSHVLIGDTTYTEPAVVEVEAGTVITARARLNTNIAKGGIYLNGTFVNGGASPYEYTVNGDINIELKSEPGTSSTAAGWVYITELQ